MPRDHVVLSDMQLADTIRELPAWSSPGLGLLRTVLAPPDATAELRRRVAEVADAMDHHPVVVDVPGGTRFEVWTHDCHDLTTRDPALAARIEAVVADLGLA